MIYIYHGATSKSDLKLAYETGFHALGFFVSGQIGIDAISKLVSNVPVLMGSFVTSASNDWIVLLDIIQRTKCQNLCIVEEVSNATIEKIKQKHPRVGIIKLFDYQKMLEQEFYRSKAFLTVADSIIISFHRILPYTIIPTANLSLLRDWLRIISKPVLFAGFGSITMIPPYLKNISPYGVIIEKHLLYSSEGTVRETLYLLKKNSIDASYEGLSSARYMGIKSKPPVSSNLGKMFEPESQQAPSSARSKDVGSQASKTISPDELFATDNSLIGNNRELATNFKQTAETGKEKDAKPIHSYDSG